MAEAMAGAHVAGVAVPTFVVDMGVGLDHFRRMHRWEAIGPLVAGIAGRMGQAVTPLARARTSCCCGMSPVAG